MARISFEQKGTKATKEELFFVAFVCFCGDVFAMRGADGEFLIREIRTTVSTNRAFPTRFCRKGRGTADGQGWTRMGFICVNPRQSVVHYLRLRLCLSVLSVV
jgi:hypothetical protein